MTPKEMSTLRKILTIVVLAAAAALASAPAAAQSSTDAQSIERQQRMAGSDAFYNLGTGGVPPP